MHTKAKALYYFYQIKSQHRINKMRQESWTPQPSGSFKDQKDHVVFYTLTEHDV